MATRREGGRDWDGAEPEKEQGKGGNEHEQRMETGRAEVTRGGQEP